MPQHDANAAPSAAQPVHQGKGGEEVPEAQGVIHRHGPAVGPGDLGAIVRHQPGEDGEKGHRGIVGQQADQLHHYLRDGGQATGHRAVGAAGEIGGEAQQHGKDDEGQHGPAAQQAHEILGGEEIYQQLTGGGIVPYGLGGQRLPRGQHRGKCLHQQEHQHGGEDARHHEGQHRDAHDAPGPADAPHPGDGSGDGGKHQRHHHAEHEVDENLPQRADGPGGGRPQPAGDAAGEHGRQHGPQKSVIFQHGSFFHSTPPVCQPMGAWPCEGSVCGGEPAPCVSLPDTPDSRSPWRTADSCRPPVPYILR